MVSEKKQDQFKTIFNAQFTTKELMWLSSKIAIVSQIETSSKFNVFFSLVSRFIENKTIICNDEEIETLEHIYPGFSKTTWNKQDIARVSLMIDLPVSVNKAVLTSFFEIAEMKEQVSLYKALYLLQNASEFKPQVAEGIRTNMVNVFDAIASGNPFASSYLDDNEWNQLILKSFFMDRKIYNIQNIDTRKNENLANMLQDYVKERWAAGRQVSLEIWRMIDGYLRDDIKVLCSKKQFEGIEKEVMHKILESNNSASPQYWNTIGKEH